jgi:hypothetical protein
MALRASEHTAARVKLNIFQSELALLRTFWGHRRGHHCQAFCCLLLDLAETAIMTIPQETARVAVPLTRVGQRRLARMPIMVRPLVDGNMREEIRWG